MVAAMGLPQPKPYITPQQYYELERAAEFKSEWFNGEMFPLGGVAMAGSTTCHSRIKTNLTRELGNRLKGKRCVNYDSDQRVKIPATGLRAYPDASIFCGRMEYDLDDDQADTATNPTMLFEVLSDSTEGYDRGRKAENYRQLESLQAYALLSQNEPHIEVYHRQSDGNWLFTEASGMDATLALPALEIVISLAEIYDQVTFPPSPLRLVPKA